MFTNIKVFFVITNNKFSYYWLVFMCLLFGGVDRNNVRWMLRNFIIHCDNRGIDPFDSTSALYKSRYCFSISSITSMKSIAATRLVKETLDGFEDTDYSSSTFIN